MENYTKTKYRYFAFSFAAAFFLLSLLFLLLMALIQPKTPKSLQDENQLNELASSYVPTKAESITVFFVGDFGEDAMSNAFVLARFDPAAGKIPIIVFPAQTAVFNNGKLESIADVYKYGGAEYLRDTLSTNLNIPIDRYARIRLDAYIAAAAAIGTVEYELPESITIDRSGAIVTISRGKQLLDGQIVTDIIRFNGYEGGELERCEITSQLTSAIVNQRMDICLSTVIDSVFEKIINLIGTDISYQDYHDRKPAAEFLAKMEAKAAEPVYVDGAFNSDNSLYTLSDTFTARLTQILR